MSKTKIIAFRVDEDLFIKYSSLNIKSRKKFVNKCNELLEKFLALNVNKSSNENVNKLNVNKSSNEEDEKWKNKEKLSVI